MLGLDSAWHSGTRFAAFVDNKRESVSRVDRLLARQQQQHHRSAALAWLSWMRSGWRIEALDYCCRMDLGDRLAQTCSGLRRRSPTLE